MKRASGTCALYEETAAKRVWTVDACDTREDSNLALARIGYALFHGVSTATAQEVENSDKRVWGWAVWEKSRVADIMACLSREEDSLFSLLPEDVVGIIAFGRSATATAV